VIGFAPEKSIFVSLLLIPMEKLLLLQVKNLSVSFQSEDSVTRAVDSISFDLHEGETIGIVGESGSGKSVTALSILRLIDPPAGKIDSGEILLTTERQTPHDLLLFSEKEMRKIRGKEISMIFQEPMTSLNPVLNCGYQVMEPLLEHLKLNTKEAKSRTIELFNEVKLPRAEAIFRSYPHQLSGGQKQRVMIAMAISCNPKILIADEPTTALDVTVQKTILELLKELQAKHRMSILFITHDLGLVSDFADKILVMYKGRIVEQGQTRELFNHPQHPYTQGLLNCRPPMDVRLRTLFTVNDFMGEKGEEGIEKAGNVITAEERKASHQKIYSNTPILEVNDLVTRFPVSWSLFGKVKRYLNAVDNVSFRVYPGETLGIVGESGCGKTTLGRTILNLIRASSGKIVFEGKELSTMPPKLLREIRKDIQIIFQDPYSSLNPRLMAGAAITEPMKVHGLHHDDKTRKEVAFRLLQKVGLEEKHFHRYPHEFSGGQRQRICIARALALQPKLIICDESVSALDVSIQAQVLNLLNDLKNEFNFTYLFISHDLSVVRYMSDRLIVMKAGKIEEIGDSDEIYAHPVSSYTKQLLEAIPKVY
jgi:peptide/nickel transport system ATP-binding protein